jgi:hypothetical protein
MPDLSVVDDDNGIELTGLRRESLTFNTPIFKDGADNQDSTTKKYVRGALVSECDPGTR